MANLTRNTQGVLEHDFDPGDYPTTVPQNHSRELKKKLEKDKNIKNFMLYLEII